MSLALAEYYCETIFLFFVLLYAGIHDAKTHKIPNRVPLILFIGWIILNAVDIFFASQGLVDYNVSTALDGCVRQLVETAVVVFVFMCMYIIFDKISSMSKSNIFLGMGDAKLITALTLFMGIRHLLYILLASCAFFLIYALARYVLRNSKTRRAAFAPSIFLGYTTFVIVYIILKVL